MVIFFSTEIFYLTYNLFKEILSVILFDHFSGISIPFKIIFDGISFHKFPVTFTRFLQRLIF